MKIKEREDKDEALKPQKHVEGELHEVERDIKSISWIQLQSHQTMAQLQGN